MREMIYKHRKIVIIVSSLVVFLVYLSFLPAPFYFDDFYNIVYNPDLSSFASALGSRVGGFRPLAYLSFYIDKRLFGLFPAFLRLENIVFHVINFLLVFNLVKTLLEELEPSDRFTVSFFVASLWALNPINSQSVAYIVQRMNEVSSLFIFAGFLVYLNYLRNKNLFYLFLFFVFFLLGLGFKETGILLIPLCLLHYVFFVNTRRGIIFSLVFLIAVFLAVLTIPPFQKILPLWYVAGGEVPLKGFTIFQKLMTAPKIALDYIIVTLLPFYRNIHLYYSVAVVKSPLSLSFLLPFLTLAAFIIVPLWIFRRNKLITFSITAFFMLLFPENFLLPLDLAYQHRMYLPSVFLILAVILLIFKIKDEKVKDFTLGGIVIFFVINLLARGLVFSFPAYFYKNELRFAASNPKVYVNASKNMLAKNKLEDAYYFLSEGLKRFPDNPKLAMNYGLFFAKQGDFDSAIKWYKKAVTPNNPFLNQVYWSLAVLYFEKKDYPNAKKYLAILKDKNFSKDKIKQLEQKIDKAYSADTVSE